MSTVRSNSNRYLCALQREGSGSPLYIIPSAGTTPLSLVNLARSVDPKHPIYSFGFAGIDDEESPHENVESMAAAYAAEIQTAQPSGPYYVGGHCFGGTVALAIANHIEAQGEQVALLVLLDTITPKASVAEVNNSDTGKRAPEVNRLKAEVERSIKLVYEKSITQYARLPAVVAQRLEKVLWVHIEAGLRYKCTLTKAKIALFWTSSYDELVFQGWRSVGTDGFSEFAVPGDTFSMLKPPHVGILGKRLGNLLSTLP